ILADLAPVPRHPDIVPAKHNDRDAENGGVEDFLAGARERIGQGPRESRHQRRAQEPGENAARDIEPARWQRPGRGQLNADDQSSFDDLAQDDDKGADHANTSMSPGLARHRSLADAYFKALAAVPRCSGG